jgi:hypothetical protein
LRKEGEREKEREDGEISRGKKNNGSIKMEKMENAATPCVFLCMRQQITIFS